jgi:hypothetical protein
MLRCRYGASGCSRFVGLRTFLADPILGNPRVDYSWIRPLAEKASREGKEIVWSEGNVFSCGGNPCMSHSFASALWFVDNALEAAHAGVTRALLHANPDHEYV